MNAFLHHDALLLAGGITAVLLLASIIGVALKVKVAKGKPHVVIDNLNTRVNTWWVMTAVIGLALLAGRTGVTLLFAFASFAALREFTASATRADHAALVSSFFFALPLQYFLVWIGRYELYAAFIPIYAFVALPIVAVVLGVHRSFLQRARTLQWGLVLCVFCVSHVPALLTLEIPGYEGRNAFLLMFFILVVQSSDVLQYIWGKLAGRRRIAPGLSPSKTVEGLVGGVLSATALGAVLSPFTPFPVVQAALISFAITLLGFAGGLVMSAIKRRRGIKDWGAMIKGHGGMLDRLDSVCFSAPVFFHIVRLGWT